MKKITEMTLAESRLYTAKLNLKIITDVINGKTSVPSGLTGQEYAMYLLAKAMIGMIEYLEIKEEGK